jgi:regulatory protein
VNPDKQLIEKARKYCAYQERSQQEVRDKLYEWGSHKQEVETIISVLISEDFINEERFAIALAGGKFRIKKWGRIKIVQALKLHRISDYCMNKALQQIDEDDYRTTLQDIMKKKLLLIKSGTKKDKISQLIKYAQSKGYEWELVYDVAKNMVEGE